MRPPATAGASCSGLRRTLAESSGYLKWLLGPGLRSSSPLETGVQENCTSTSASIDQAERLETLASSSNATLPRGCFQKSLTKGPCSLSQCSVRRSAEGRPWRAELTMLDLPLRLPHDSVMSETATPAGMAKLVVWDPGWIANSPCQTAAPILVRASTELHRPLSRVFRLVVKHNRRAAVQAQSCHGAGKGTAGSFGH